MKEIGGYFELDQFINNEYYRNLLALNSGRHALQYILEARKIKKIYIPYFLCDSISNMLKINKCNFEYYNIDNKFIPIFNKKLLEEEYIYIVNYYGQINNKLLFELKKDFKRVIVDNTHAFFQKPIQGIDTIYSCRKFFGVSDGAYISTNSILNKKLQQDISKDRMEHILGRYEGNASEYYNSFKCNDEAFESETIKYMSKLTHNILGALDYEKIIRVRNENYNYLEEKLNKHNKLKLVKQVGPFTYPLYIEDGYKVKKKLIKKKIYISTLWPNVLENMYEESLEYKLAANILPIPCDQRYSKEDMEYVIKELREFV